MSYSINLFILFLINSLYIYIYEHKYTCIYVKTHNYNNTSYIYYLVKIILFFNIFKYLNVSVTKLKMIL
jgi:hypothetical protein